MKTAFLFPGQGAQVVGMGADIAKAFPAAARTYQKANDILGFDLAKICFEGPEEQLNTTTISQPAIFTTSAAMLRILNENPATAELKPEVTAGLSLGEYTALYAAGLMTFEDTLKLVYKRGQAMQSASEATEGSMVSVIGLDDHTAGQLCRDAAQDQILRLVNFNCPGQIVLSGAKEACARAEHLAEKFGAIKAIPLQVAGAFHTEMMASAAKLLAEALADTQIAEPMEIRTIASVNAKYYDTAEQIAHGLTLQLTKPILWQKCMEKMLADGFDEFFEIGPSRVLTGLAKRINRKTKIVNVSNLITLTDLIESYAPIA